MSTLRDLLQDLRTLAEAMKGKQAVDAAVTSKLPSEQFTSLATLLTSSRPQGLPGAVRALHDHVTRELGQSPADTPRRSFAGLAKVVSELMHRRAAAASAPATLTSAESAQLERELAAMPNSDLQAVEGINTVSNPGAALYGRDRIIRALSARSTAPRPQTVSVGETLARRRAAATDAGKFPTLKGRDRILAAVQAARKDSSK